VNELLDFLKKVESPSLLPQISLTPTEGFTAADYFEQFILL